MRPHRVVRHGSASRPRGSPIPARLPRASLGDEFELFSDRNDHAVERETLISDFVSLHDQEAAADDGR